MEAELDLAVKFQEPTVSGWTGAQHRQLRLWEDEQRCAYIFFDRGPKGPEERCVEDAEEGSRFCEDHIPEQDYDSIGKDLRYGHDD